MTSNFKFIHSADIHLGSILHVNPKVDKTFLETFDNAVYNAFEKICDIAVKEKVKFLLLCGDIYDKEARTVKANSFFVKQCKKLELENINIFIIGGNHDPIKGNKELFNLPSNVFIFSPDKPEIIDLKDEQGFVYCKIIGQSYKEAWESRKMYENYNSFKDDIFTIAMLHTQMDSNNNYVPCTFLDLKSKENISYWALGHIHKPQIISPKDPVIIYPGIPQGRDFGEEGMGGAFLIEAENNKVSKIDFIKTSKFIWKKVDIKIDINNESEPKNLSDLENMVIYKAEEIVRANEIIKNGCKDIYIEEKDCLNGYIVNWTLSGRGEVYEYINDKEEAEDYFIESLNNKLIRLKPFVFTNSIQFNIGKPIEAFEELKAENNIIKAVTEAAKNFLENEAIKVDLLNRFGSLWEVTDSIEDMNVKKFQLDREVYESIISNAEQLIIDLLLQRGEEV